jgi:hypothetical protein
MLAQEKQAPANPVVDNSRRFGDPKIKSNNGSGHIQKSNPGKSLQERNLVERE